jgi:hypothetical protein
MENTIKLQPNANPYLEHFQLALRNLNLLVQEERIQKRIQKSKRNQKSHD